MPTPRLLPFALAAFLSVAATAHADEAAEARGWPALDAYDPAGPFVSWPAKALGLGALIVSGGAATIVCTPVDLVVGVVRRGGYGTLAERCASGVGGAVAQSVYLVAGAPFYVGKTVFWDWPRRAFCPAAPAAPAAAEPPQP
ncbi:MAG: hypothetical protein ACRERC_21615 [Candidatus Binatia bacterium]